MGDLRLATFNLKDFFEARPERGETERAIIEEKLVNVAASLRRANADVVALQEVGSVALIRRLVAAVPDLGYGEPVVGSEDRRGIRNVILSRLPVQWSQVHEAKSLPSPRFFEGDPDPFPDRIPLRRGIVHIRIEAGELGEVDVLTAHFKSGLPTLLKTPAGVEIPDATQAAFGASAVRSLYQRVAEALFVRALVDDIFSRSPDHAICVMGDLNDVLWSLPVRLVRGLDPQRHGHLYACSERLPEDRRFSSFHGYGSRLIDHVLVSERLRQAVVSYEIHNEALRDHGPPVPDPPFCADSDHALCVVALGTGIK